MSRSDGEEEQR